VDVIHTHNGRTAFLAAVAVRLARRGRLVTSQHFLHPSHTKQSGPRLLLAQAIHLWIYRTAAACIAVSGAVKDALLARRQIEPGKVRVVPNGINVREAEVSPEEKMRICEELGVAPGVPLVMCVARLEPEKDVSTLVAAMTTVRQSFPQSRCVIVGGGREREALLRQAHQSGLKESVVFTGFRIDASLMIAACDLFVLPSATESFGLVLLEAMKHAKPLIATRAGGPQEVVVHNETGLLVPPGDSAALASAISSLLANPERARALGICGRERLLDLYTAERMARKIAAVYREAFETR
jgi:glycosyltransferase involved in cell wall biosynthesis